MDIKSATSSVNSCVEILEMLEVIV
jgi:hypothetical protein